MLLPVLSGDQTKLRQKSEPINEITDEIRKLAQNLVETMREKDGIGLAAPQVGINKQIFVAELPPDPEDKKAPSLPLHIIINPTIEFIGEATDIAEEGCLSLPGYYGDVSRPLKIRVKALNLEGEKIDLQLEGFPARIFQHEYDHLQGVLFTDKLVDPARLRYIDPKQTKESQT